MSAVVERIRPVSQESTLYTVYMKVNLHSIRCSPCAVLNQTFRTNLTGTAGTPLFFQSGQRRLKRFSVHPGPTRFMFWFCLSEHQHKTLKQHSLRAALVECPPVAIKGMQENDV